MASCYDDWIAGTGQNPPPVVFAVLGGIADARKPWEPRTYDDAWHHREWFRKQGKRRDDAVKWAERDVCRAVETAIDSGGTWSSEVADAVAAVRVARAWASCGWFNADDIDAFLASDLGLDDWIDARASL